LAVITRGCFRRTITGIALSVSHPSDRQREGAFASFIIACAEVHADDCSPLILVVLLIGGTGGSLQIDFPWVARGAFIE
jgi:hypothetical protein